MENNKQDLLNGHKERYNMKQVIRLTEQDLNNIIQESVKQIIKEYAETPKNQKLLGRLYKITGVVSKGSQIGNKIGYPTANINIDESYCLLKKGVYAVRIQYNNKYYLGICNYGYNPSFNKIIKPRLEIHIFDFNEDIYGEVIDVEFIENIRDEFVFPTVDDFLNQLKKDCDYCKNNYGGNYENINCRCNG
jgi:riboflavin kinase/FMN adenylyltransferase